MNRLRPERFLFNCFRTGVQLPSPPPLKSLVEPKAMRSSSYGMGSGWPSTWPLRFDLGGQAAFWGGPRACPRGLISPELPQELHSLPYRVSGRGPWCLYSWDLGRDMELLGLVSASSASRAAKASIISSALVLIVVSRKRASVNSSKDVPPIPTSAMFITTPPASRERRCA